MQELYRGVMFGFGAYVGYQLAVKVLNYAEGHVKLNIVK